MRNSLSDIDFRNLLFALFVLPFVELVVVAADQALSFKVFVLSASNSLPLSSWWPLEMLIGFELCNASMLLFCKMIECSLVSADTSGVDISENEPDNRESVWLELSKMDRSNESSSSASLNVSSRNEVFSL